MLFGLPTMAICPGGALGEGDWLGKLGVAPGAPWKLFGFGPKPNGPPEFDPAYKALPYTVDVEF